MVMNNVIGEANTLFPLYEIKNKNFPWKKKVILTQPEKVG